MPGENGGMLAKEPSCRFRYSLLGISVIEIGREGVCAESQNGLRTCSLRTLGDKNPEDYLIIQGLALF